MKNKKKFVAVIGPGASGKSSIISSISGCRKSNFYGLIVDQSNGNSVFVCCASPQETPSITLTSVRKEMKNVKSKNGCTGMIMAIQPSQPTARLSMEVIIQEALSQNFEVYAFVLDPGYQKTISGIFGNVSQRLTPLGVSPAKLHALNGSQFAVKNAIAINAITSLFA